MSVISVKSIRIHLLLLVLVSVLPALALILYSGMEHRWHNIEEAKADSLRVIRNLGYDHERSVESARQFLMTLARLPDVQKKNGPACNRLFARLLRESPLYSGIFAADSHGTVFAGAPFSSTFSIRREKLFQNVLKTREFSVGEYSVGTTSPRRVLAFACPVIGPNGLCTGLVAANLDLDRYGEMFIKTKLPEDSVLAIFDHRNVYLYLSRNAAGRVGKTDAPNRIAYMSARPEEGMFADNDSQGVKRLYAYKGFYLGGSASPYPYLFVRVGVPESKALFPARRTLLRNLAFLCSAMVLAMVSAWFLGGSLIVKRLNALADASRRLGQGDLTARTGLAHWRDELGEVTRAFDAMAARLEQREAHTALAEEALRQGEEKYRNIFENAVEGIFQTTPEGLFLTANPALARIAGYESPEELLAGVTDIGNCLYVDPEDRKRFREIIEKNGFIEQYEAQFYRKDGARVWFSLNARVVRDADGNVLCYEGIGNDITERKRAEEALVAAHQQLLDIIEFLPDATLVIDNRRNVIAWNKAMEKMTGVRKEEVLGKGDHAYAVPICGERRPLVIDLIFEDDEGTKKYVESIRKEDDSFFAEVSIPPGSPGAGSYRSVKASPLLDGDGKIIGAIESIRDLTDFKRVERELRESEERYRTAIESSNDGIAILKDRKHLYVNRKYLQIFGFNSPEEVLGKPVDITVHEDDRERVIEMNNRRRQKSEETPDPYEFKGVKTNGDVVFIEVFATETTHRGESVTLGYLRDITGRKSLESQLLQAQKMEAIGTLAAGVAHDFNNILTTLMGYGNLLQMKMSPDDPLLAYVDHILASTGKAASLTQSLLTFGRKQVMELKPHTVADLVKDASMLFRRLLPEDTELTITLGEDVTVMADMTQISQVLMNLVTNARDAMPKGGVLKIETASTRIDQTFRRFHGYGELGKYALISVTDTGTGMSGKTKEKIFEPFFTTKEVGKGTGLGLSIVYGIVKQHGGYITVYSEEGIGTTFRIYLPVAKAQAADLRPAPPDVPGGAETILFAEDNDDIRRMSCDILGLLGYTVIEAVDGADAVEKFKSHRDKIDLLVFDVVMPVMNGKEAYRKIRAMKKDIKALFMSGYTNDVVFEKGIRKGAVDWVSKPLSPSQLLHKVREVLDAGKEQGVGLSATKEESKKEKLEKAEEKPV